MKVIRDEYDMFARASLVAMIAYSEQTRLSDPLLANQLLM